MIRITLLGDASKPIVGGVLIEAAGKRVLVDPGGLPGDVNTLPEGLVASAHLDAIVITHAHADHSWGLPSVLAIHHNVPVFATPSTGAMLQLLGRLTADQTRMLPFGDVHPLTGNPEERGWTVRLQPAGHVLGAATAVFQTPEGCVVCSGDVSLVNQYTVRRAARPRQRADVLVLESTYGEREFRPRAAEEARLVGQVRAALERGGHVLIAVSPLGPAQEIVLTLLQGRISQEITGAIWVDGMVGPVNDVYAQWASLDYPRLARFIARHGNPFRPDDALVVVAQPQDRQGILQGPPAIIVTNGPTLQSGPSAFYAEALFPGAKHLILLPAGPEAKRNLAWAVEPGTPHCELGTYGLMSHADGAALAALAARWHPELVVLNHGRPEAKTALHERLAALGIPAVLATPGEPVIWP